MSINKVEVSILRSLRRSASARFNELQRPTGLTSDDFKFYLRKLVKVGYVIKLPDGAYGLTTSGKEFANNIDRHRLTIQKQPKVSICLVLTRRNSDGQTEYLFQERRRQPFMHYWGFLSGPVQWGEDILDTANRELLKQTGLHADFTVRSLYRVRDYSQNHEQILEDKLFVVLTANSPEGELSDSWAGGHSSWLSLKDLDKKDKVFASTPTVLAMLTKRAPYGNHDFTYAQHEY